MKIHRLSFYISFILLLVVCPSCSKFLDIAPEDKYTEDQVFSNEETIKQALTGIYMNLVQDDLYGSSLTLTTVEFFGQRFPVNYNNQTYNSFIWYDYYAENVRDNLAAIWSSGYNTILKTNKFLERLEEAVSGGIIPPERADILAGEAYAIRAMLHFDLLRLFASTNMADTDTEAIPYYTQAEAVLQPFVSAPEAIDRISSDLAIALEKLANDAVRTIGVDLTNTDFYTSYRNRRLNYFAVSALLARVYLYGQQPEAAYQIAKELVAKLALHFPWLPYGQILNDQINPDRIFSTEVLLGLENQYLYQKYNSLFSPELTIGELLSANPQRLAITFEYNQNDYRYTTTWLNSAKGFRTFHKFADVEDTEKPWRFLQPVIRKSELYYILAETASDPLEALGYLNEVRYHRGLGDLPVQADLPVEIQKEYQKEFYGEGQLFFYYKRRGLDAIPDGSSEWEFYGPIYTFPIPDAELSSR